mgnify:CR=1 FL=1
MSRLYLESLHKKAESSQKSYLYTCLLKMKDLINFSMKTLKNIFYTIFRVVCFISNKRIV